jgi:energy-coupling factor transporter ATP-binding protein EcfA2
MTVQAQSKALRRIHIVGGPGSGKTSLARALGAALNIPTYELDKIAFEGVDFTSRPLHDRLNDVRKIAGEVEWITEGIFLNWTDELLRMADVIIWLDHVKWQTAAVRIVRRFAYHGINEVKRQQGVRKFNRFQDYRRNLRHLVRVLYTSKQYYDWYTVDETGVGLIESRLGTARCLSGYASKVIHCQAPAEVDGLIRDLIAAQKTAVQSMPETIGAFNGLTA